MSEKWYSSSVEYIQDKLSKVKKIDGMDLLNDFVLEHRELFDELELSDFDNFVTDNFEDLQDWLINQKFDWLKISPNDGIWYFEPSNELPDNVKSSVLEQKLNFTDDEKKLINEELYNLNKSLVNEYRQLLKKLAGNRKGKENIVYQCKHKLAICAAEDHTILALQRVDYWLEAAEAALLVEKESTASKCYEIAAKTLQKENEHEDAAINYKKALELRGDAKEKVQLSRYARIQFELLGEHNSASEMFVLEKNIEQQNETDVFKKYILWFYGKISLYGEKPSLVIKAAFCLLLFCSTLIFLNGASTIDSMTSVINSTGLSSEKICILLSNAWDSIYYAFVTFTTLGYGEITPDNAFGKLISILLSVSGLLLTSLFMVTFVRKYSRP